jgi:hypothetical protein
MLLVLCYFSSIDMLTILVLVLCFVYQMLPVYLNSPFFLPYLFFKRFYIEGVCGFKKHVVKATQTNFIIIMIISRKIEVSKCTNIRGLWCLTLLLSNLYHLSILMAYGCILFLFISCIVFILIFDCSWRGVLDITVWDKVCQWLAVVKATQTNFIIIMIISRKIEVSKCTNIRGLWCLTLLSTILQLYRGSQFLLLRKPEYPEKTTVKKCAV